MPSTSTPRLQHRDFNTPNFNTPDFNTPDFNTPDFNTPDFNTPDFNTPNIDKIAFLTSSSTTLRLNGLTITVWLAVEII
ncbi:uncharacterized protein N7446_007861 [Penicillium canescens]|uniref:Uncharacterized protein n=1 Tax=Penicillium canescens TaxID=5083 RepID=A0AAD6NDY8_PENCN|nr:uncharacterized protein N7446_007861 [Penicillium canescens]KAJ6033848.1 hypothetical protein N7444_011619 [Penicillium canescens]KAJ6056964.1 hypothetical protein N7460_000238 [Penicillium canescens]KAJ6058278.1 hypothetical protein N7446_007861 [Penicillium canescens]